MGDLQEVRYPEVWVPMVGEDGNAFAILGRVEKALRVAGVPVGEIAIFHRDATADDYDHLLRTVMQWVSVDEEEE